MRQPRAVKASQSWKRLFLDPKGDLTQDGRLMMADLAKFCHANLPATMRDTQGRVDAMATMQIVGRQEAYLRIAALLSVSEIETQRLARMAWPGDVPDGSDI
jgi:hypothetical protein